MSKPFNYYSQHGEDFLLDRIFEGKKDGFFVEVGCLDGLDYSNSLFFERTGWSGICIEAHNDFIKSLQYNRPKSTIVHCAIGEADKDDVIFYANSAGSLSTLDKSEEERWKKNYANDFHGFEEQKVRMRTLTSVFDEFKVGQIDFVSLDIEGYEVKALMGMDFAKYKPTVFVIEYKDDLHKSLIDGILLNHGYYFLSKIGCNMFYSLRKEHHEYFRKTSGTVSLERKDSVGNVRVEKIWVGPPNLSMRLKAWIRKQISQP